MINIREQYWALEVPDIAYSFEICKDECDDDVIAFKSNSWLKENEYEIMNLPPGTWQIVCTSKEATDEIAKSIVVQYGDFFTDYEMTEQDYKEQDVNWFRSALYSLHSLLTSKGCDLNKNYLILKKVV